MRRRAHLLIALLAGCGNVTDGVPPELGRCAESTPDWWPLVEGTRWVYDEIFFDDLEPEARKELSVQRAPATVGGLADDQEGVRTWRKDPGGSGWRWFVDDGSAIYFRRDIWVEGIPPQTPCSGLRPDDDPRTCTDVTPLWERYYLDDGRKRLDYRPDRICENSTWTERYTTWEIPIGQDEGECPRSIWASDETACAATTVVTEDRWSVVSVSHRIAVPAGVYDDCLCVRRVGHEVGDTAGVNDDDNTYCFARGVGKVYELDTAENLVECLAQVCHYGVCEPATDLPCDQFQLAD